MCKYVNLLTNVDKKKGYPKNKKHNNPLLNFTYTLTIGLGGARGWSTFPMQMTGC